MRHHDPILVLGLGNAMLGDLGLGIVALQALRRSQRGTPDILFHRSGVVDAMLRPLVLGSHALLVIEARPFDADPGSMLELDGQAMDDGLIRYPSAEADAGAELARLAVSGLLPERRALMLVQPDRPTTAHGLSRAVSDRIPELVLRSGALISLWGASIPQSAHG